MRFLLISDTHGQLGIVNHCCPKQARNEAVTGKSP